MAELPLRTRLEPWIVLAGGFFFHLVTVFHPKYVGLVHWILLLVGKHCAVCDILPEIHPRHRSDIKDHSLDLPADVRPAVLHATCRCPSHEKTQSEGPADNRDNGWVKRNYHCLLCQALLSLPDILCNTRCLLRWLQLLDPYLLWLRVDP